MSFIFLVPVLLIGTDELLSKGKNRFKIFLLLILILNCFLLFDVVTFNQIKLSETYKEGFDFIEKNISPTERIFSNANPPSVVAWYTNRTILYSLNPDDESELKYYLHEKIYSEFLSMFPIYIQINSSNYKIIFNNSRYTIYERIG